MIKIDAKCSAAVPAAAIAVAASGPNRRHGDETREHMSCKNMIRVVFNKRSERTNEKCSLNVILSFCVIMKNCHFNSKNYPLEKKNNNTSIRRLIF